MKEKILNLFLQILDSYNTGLQAATLLNDPNDIIENLKTRNLNNGICHNNILDEVRLDSDSEMSLTVHRVISDRRNFKSNHRYMYWYHTPKQAYMLTHSKSNIVDCITYRINVLEKIIKRIQKASDMDLFSNPENLPD